MSSTSLTSTVVAYRSSTGTLHVDPGCRRPSRHLLRHNIAPFPAVDVTDEDIRTSRLCSICGADERLGGDPDSEARDGSFPDALPATAYIDEGGRLHRLDDRRHCEFSRVGAVTEIDLTDEVLDRYLDADEWPDDVCDGCWRGWFWFGDSTKAAAFLDRKNRRYHLTPTCGVGRDEDGYEHYPMHWTDVLFHTPVVTFCEDCGAEAAWGLASYGPADEDD